MCAKLCEKSSDYDSREALCSAFTQSSEMCDLNTVVNKSGKKDRSSGLCHANSLPSWYEEC